MNEIMHEPAAKSVPVFRNEDNNCRQLYETSMLGGGGGGNVPKSEPFLKKEQEGK